MELPHLGFIWAGCGSESAIFHECLGIVRTYGNAEDDVLRIMVTVNRFCDVRKVDGLPAGLEMEINAVSKAGKSDMQTGWVIKIARQGSKTHRTFCSFLP